MPRRLLIETDRFPYHVSSRSNNKEWFYIPLPHCWRIFCSQLSVTSKKYNVNVFAFTLMSNHYHLILQTSQRNIGEVMRHFLTGVSKAIQFKAKRINHVFGARYTWSLLEDPYSVAYVYKYVLRNPVRAGLAKNPENYKYNSLRDHRPIVPLMDGLGPLWQLIPRNYEARLNWLAQPTPKELETLITQGLRKESFQFSKDNTKQKKLRELKASYGVDIPIMTATYQACRETDTF